MHSSLGNKSETPSQKKVKSLERKSYTVVTKTIVGDPNTDTYGNNESKYVKGKVEVKVMRVFCARYFFFVCVLGVCLFFLDPVWVTEKHL